MQQSKVKERTTAGAHLPHDPVGDMIPKSLRGEPAGVLNLKHQRDGLTNKDYHAVK